MKQKPVVWHIGGEDVRMRIPLLLTLRERGFKIGAVGSEDGNVFYKHEIPYWHYSLDRWIGPLADYNSFRQLYFLFKEHKPDIVHAFDTKPGIIAPAAASKAGIPVRIRTVCGMGYVFSSGSLPSFFLKPLYRHFQAHASKISTATVFQNKDDRDFFLSNNMVTKGCDELVLGSGIDTTRFKSGCPDEEYLKHLRNEIGITKQRVITMITRLVKHKGVKEYLEAARRVRGIDENVIFLLAGPMSSEGCQAVSQADMDMYANDVKYLGPRNDIPALLAVSDLFVLPSYYREGVPRVLLEAGAMGLPIITTDMPGCKEVVRHDWNGWLVKPRDAQSLKDAIQQALGLSSDNLNVMGKRSLLHVEEHFTLGKVTEAYAEIYESALNKNNHLPIP
ncbi:MAG: glycosyltransferase family 4 protein [Desulfobacteraceae bacterium]|nr:glycosyltransferase family 4 protein [Desulfobacteraceae bacterium]